MLEFTVAGLALGSIYAIVASGLVITYVSAGVLNFAFGPMAFFLARFYYFLHSEQGMGILPSFVIAVVIGGPALGVVLYYALFQHIRRSSTLIKIVATIGLSVALPAASRLIFGDLAVTVVPGLAPEPVAVYRIGGVAINLNQVLMMGALVLLVVAGGLVLKFTQVGLVVRAMVDTEAMSQLVGVNTRLVSVGVWAFSSFLAGVAGVLVAPTVGLSSDQFILLVSAAFAAVVIARFVKIGIAIAAGLLIGWLTTVIQSQLPSDSSWTTAVVASTPFALMLAVLLYYRVTGKGADEDTGVGGALDRAIAVVDTGTAKVAEGASRRLSHGSRGPLFAPGVLIAIVCVALLPQVLPNYWVGLVAQGICMAVVFLSFTLLTGQGGMVWLCQAALAGIGAVTTAQLVTEFEWPVIGALLAAGVVTSLFGLVIGLVTIRLGNLYIALVTLSFALLIQTMMFTREWIENSGAGIALLRPDWLDGDADFLYFGLIIFSLASLVVLNFRRSTAGLALAAVRSSEAGARSIAINVVQAKLMVAVLASATAGVGGGMMALYAGAATPLTYSAILGMVWLAVLVTMGVRSNVAALFAGMALTVFPGIFTTYFPHEIGDLPTVLFGVGAILVARDPDGVVATQARQIAGLASRLRARVGGPPSATPPPGDDMITPAPQPAREGVAR
ncbi:ABC transporter permease [Gordonia alkanivorans]|uniref:ABC transporter permease n=1 Tax=Gordonia alkanivorans TaxID=84096 RepID=UPI00244A3402|nr:ABC transporter permease [Gordonia alkanivorans]MDH3012639.1 ABC transporter permease [Gordonia alkanivorans]